MCGLTRVRLEERWSLSIDFFLAMETTAMVEAGIKTFALPADEWGIDSERWLDLFSNPKPSVPTYYKSKRTLNLTSKVVVNQLFLSWMKFRKFDSHGGKGKTRCFEIIKLCCLQNIDRVGLLLLRGTNRSKCTKYLHSFHFISREIREIPFKIFILSPVDVGLFKFSNFPLNYFFHFHSIMKANNFVLKKIYSQTSFIPMLFTISFPQILPFVDAEISE